MENKPKSEHLPIYGVDPFYGVDIILSTIICIVLSAIGVLNSGKIHNTVFMIVFYFSRSAYHYRRLLSMETFSPFRNCVLAENEPNSRQLVDLFYATIFRVLKYAVKYNIILYEIKIESIN